MRRLARPILAPSILALPAIAVGLSLGCGGGPPPEDPSQPIAIGSGQKGVAGDVALAPAPEPEHLVGLARWRSPAQSLGALAACGNLPPELLSAGSEAAVEAIVRDALADRVDVERFAALVSLDAPVDVAVALDPSPKRRDAFVAVSFGLTSFEQARAAAEAAGPTREVAPGLLKIKGERDAPACVVARASGAAPARLVCGPRDRDLVALGPYLTRTVAGAAAPAGAADIHAEARVSAAEARYGALFRQLLGQLPFLAQRHGAIGDKTFDDALVRAAGGLQDEIGALASDLDRVSLDIGVSPTECLRVTTALALKGTKSWTAGALLERPERAGPPPALWSKLPKDATSASFGRAADPARSAAMRQVLHDLLLGFMTKENIGDPADRKMLAELLLLTTSKDANFVMASGNNPPPAPKAQKTTGEPSPRAVLSGLLGWRLVGLEDKPDTTAKILTNLVTVYGKKGVQGFLAKKVGPEDARFLPKARLVRAPRGLPKGSLEVELRLDVPVGPPDFGAPPAPDQKARKPQKRPTETVTIHFLLMPEGDATWLAAGSDRAELVRRLEAIKGQPAPDKTLATRGGIDELRQGKAMSGGFFTLAGLTGGAAALDGTAAGRASGFLALMPNKGEVPMVWATHVSGPSAPARVDLSLHVPKGVFVDVGTIANAAVGLMGLGGPPPAPPAP